MIRGKTQQNTGEKKMEQMNMFKQMIDFNNAAFNNTFNAMVTLQEQMEKTTNTLIDMATWLPEEGRNAIKGWVGTCKAGREEFKSAIDENVKKSEEFFNTAN
ncbi:conserved uncharacterized protein [Desulfococcus multivorans]|nr:conserved uncharacterized protein [Desulfococcus multivorans]